MKIVSNTVWDGLKLPDYRARFFIEVWKEILYVNTPSFYQSKMINTMSGAEELVKPLMITYKMIRVKKLIINDRRLQR